MSRSPKRIVLRDGDSEELGRLVRRHSSSHALVTRARIVLGLANGETVSEVASRLGITERVVYRWCKRYETDGVSGLSDRPRTGRPPVLDSEKAKEILRLTVSSLPQESTHWSVRLMAKYAAVSTRQVRQVWSSADLKPHRLKTFKISKDPHFAEKVVDVVGLYLAPPTHALVLSVDEKTQIQALDRTQPMLQLRPGQVERRTHDYKRNGTLSLYAAFNTASGQVLGKVTERHTAADFLAFLRYIDRHTPPELALHLILDNSSTHKTPAVQTWLGKHPRFKLHFTPTSASWLNAVEGWFSLLERRSVHRGTFTSIGDLRREIERFITAHNAHAAKPFVWRKSAKAILDSVDRAKQAAGI
jgi:transposase